jgi:hypothetical protein
LLSATFNACLTFIEIDARARVGRLPTCRRGRINPRHASDPFGWMPREWPVQLRWRLLRVNLFQSVILSFYPLGFCPRDGRGATGKSLTHLVRPRCAKRVSPDESGQIPPRGSDQSRKAIRVKVPSGSFNACQRREFACGDTCDRVKTRLGDRSKKAAANSSTVKGPSRACWSAESETC